MSESNEGVGAFVAKNLGKHSEVENVELLATQVVRIIRKKAPPFLAGAISVARVERETIEPLLSSKFQIEFIVNVPRESFWTGGAILLASVHAVSFGSLRDLWSAMAIPDIRHYENKEFAFVERGLHQHSRVHDFLRLHDRLYVVMRRNLPDVKVVFLNEYELTADHVRTARDRYGIFADIVITNPNGTATSSAEQAAGSMGAKIYKWGKFFERLAKQ